MEEKKLAFQQSDSEICKLHACIFWNTYPNYMRNDHTSYAMITSYGVCQGVLPPFLSFYGSFILNYIFTSLFSSTSVKKKMLEGHLT